MAYKLSTIEKAENDEVSCQTCVSGKELPGEEQLHRMQPGKRISPVGIQAYHQSEPEKGERPITYKDRYADRYAELKAQHRCVNCKKALPADYKMVRCARCLDYSRKSHRKKAELEKRRQAYAPRKPHTVPLTISQVVKMAAERHVSYGEMVAIIERGGT